MEVGDFHNRIIKFIAAWDEKRKVSSNEQAAFIHLIEEIGELAREYVNRESRKDRYSEKELENAIGDAYIWLVELAHIRGLDVKKLILNIIKEEQKFL